MIKAATEVIQATIEVAADLIIVIEYHFASCAKQT